MVDLHAHSNVSDGTMTPAALVAEARRRGLSALALTDHDTVEGVGAALAAAADGGIELVPGVEMSLGYSSGTMHLIGLFVDCENAPLKAGLERLRLARSERNPLIIERLCAAGMEITLSEVEEVSGGGVTGRPHIAAVLVEKGYAVSIKEAFRKYLERGRPAFVDKARLGALEAIDLVRGAGGVSVLCHPLQTLQRGEALLSLFAGLRDLGLDAVEVYHSEHDAATTVELAAMAALTGLLPSGGSDFHGSHKPDVGLGEVHCGVPLPVAILEVLRQRSERSA